MTENTPERTWANLNVSPTGNILQGTIPTEENPVVMQVEYVRADRIEELGGKLARAERANDALEELRPVWAQGGTRHCMCGCIYLEPECPNCNKVTDADRIEALTEQLEAARTDAELNKTYAEELDAKMKDIEQELLRRVKFAEESKKLARSGTSQKREHYRMHALSEALGAVRNIMKGKARTTLAEIDGER